MDSHGSLTTYDDPAAFLRAVGRTLEEHEAEHNLALGIAIALASRPPSSDPLFLAALSDGSGLALVAVMAPPRPLILSSDRADITGALEPLWRGLAESGHAPRRVIGEVAHVRAFAGGWERYSGCATRLLRRQRLHKLTQIQPIPAAIGTLRIADETDVPLVVDWMTRFDRETADELTAADVKRLAERRVAAGEVVLWVDGEPRSMAARARPTPRGIAVNAVYTPHESRGRGYATTCVAQLSAQLLDEGRAFCVLFTDLANPTANAIYARIGYQPLRDYEVYALNEERGERREERGVRNEE